MIAKNVVRNIQQPFPDDCPPRWAVAYMHCEENGLLKWLFDHAEKGTMEECYKSLPMNYVKCTWICGDWAARGPLH